MSEKDKTMRSLMRILRIVFWVCVAFFAFLSFKEGEYISKPLVIGLIMVPVGVYNLITIRNNYQGSKEDRKKFTKIVISSVILAIVIVAALITTVVYVKYNVGTVEFHGKTFKRSELSSDTVGWIEWYNRLPEEEQLAIDYMPSDLYERYEYTETEDAPAQAQ